MTRTAEPRPQLVSIPAAGRQLGIGRTSTYKLIGARQLTVIKLGGRSLITQASVDALVARLAAAADGQP
jgi:hypothetical protein